MTVAGGQRKIDRLELIVPETEQIAIAEIRV
jgi:hypothetical protein